MTTTTELRELTPEELEQVSAGEISATFTYGDFKMVVSASASGYSVCTGTYPHTDTCTYGKV